MKKIFIITGDYSGDMHAAKVVQALRTTFPNSVIEAVGGQHLASCGVKLFSNHSKMNAAGFSLKILKDHFELGSRIMGYLKNEFKPDLVLLIDYGGFNLGIAKYIKLELKNTKLFYYIPPQIWASRKWRINTVKKYIDKVLYIFPFEEQLYKGNNISCEYVGHPLVEEIPQSTPKKLFCEKYKLDSKKPLIGVFPGSRSFEIKMLMPTYIKAIELIKQQLPDVQFVLCQSSNIKDKLLNEYNIPDYVSIQKNCNYELLSCADVLLLASGTVALEAALYKTPMTICYKAPWILYLIYLFVRCIDKVSLPNIILQKEVVAELIQHKCKPQIIANEIISLLKDKNKRSEMINKLTELENKLSEKQTSDEVAKIINNALL